MHNYQKDELMETRFLLGNVTFEKVNAAFKKHENQAPYPLTGRSFLPYYSGENNEYVYPYLFLGDRSVAFCSSKRFRSGEEIPFNTMVTALIVRCSENSAIQAGELIAHITSLI